MAVHSRTYWRSTPQLQNCCWNNKKSFLSPTPKVILVEWIVDFFILWSKKYYVEGHQWDGFDKAFRCHYLHVATKKNDQSMFDRLTASLCDIIVVVKPSFLSFQTQFIFLEPPCWFISPSLWVKLNFCWATHPWITTEVWWWCGQSGGQPTWALSRLGTDSHHRIWVLPSGSLT